MSSHDKQGGIAGFIAGKGFYIILFLCIAAIGVSGYVVYQNFSNIAPDETLGAQVETDYNGLLYAPENEAVRQYEPDVQTAGNPAASPSVPNMGAVAVMNPIEPETAGESDPEATGEPEAAPEGATTAPAAESEPAKLEPVTYFVRPLAGEAVKTFSGDDLVYSATMRDWRVHRGLDIAGALGETVMSIADGVVEDVFHDEMMGSMVIIRHDEETKSVYSNLDREIAVTKGQTLKAGEAIGKVGATAANESLDAPHLHLEVIRGGEYIDPATVLPKAGS